MRLFGTFAIGLSLATLGAVFGLSATAVSAESHSASEFSQVGNKQQGYGKDDINEFCTSDRVTAPESGVQFDDIAASSAVLEMVPGRYEYVDGGALLFFPDGQFLMGLPDDGREITYGTDGSDLLAGGVVGGCFVEQLSEAIANNSLDVDTFVLVSAYE